MLQNHITMKLKSVFEFNHIRLQKIMEMSQDTIVAFIDSLMAATFLINIHLILILMKIIQQF